MHRWGALAVAAALLLAGCGGDGESPTVADGGQASSSAPAVDPNEYGDDLVAAFRDTYPDTPRYEGDRGEASDWAAFVAVLQGLEPPEDLQVEHEQIIAAFDAYVEGDRESESVCSESPTSGACYGAVFDAIDLFDAAIERALEIPGVTRGRLLG